MKTGRKIAGPVPEKTPDFKFYSHFHILTLSPCNVNKFYILFSFCGRKFSSFVLLFRNIDIAC